LPSYTKNEEGEPDASANVGAALRHGTSLTSAKNDSRTFMTNEEKILAAIDDLKKSHDAFASEWRTARAEARVREAQMEALRTKRIAESATKGKELRRAYFFAFAAIIVVVVLMFFLFEFFPPRR
jgi:hypothetical protein